MYDELTGNLRAQATHFSVHDETSLLLLKAADAIEDLDNKLNLHRQGKISHWIPVTEQLPKEYGHYFANIVGGEFAQISCAEIVYFDGKIFRWEHISTEYPEEVTHWMPLPEPPKDGEA